MSKTRQVIAFLVILMIAAGTGAWAQSTGKAGSTSTAASKDTKDTKTTKDTAKEEAAKEAAEKEAAAKEAAAKEAAAKEEAARVAAQAKSVADLRAIGDSEFAFISFRDPLLYPETSILVNPAMAAGFTSSLVSGVLDLPYERSDETLIRTDDSIGQKNGTSRTVDETLTPDLSFMTLFSSGSKQSPLVWGVFGDFLLEWARTQTQNTNYDTISESEVVTDFRWPLSASLGGLLAGGPRVSGWGVSAQYSFTMDLHSYEETDSMGTDGTITSAWADALNDSDIYTHDLDVRLGKRFPLSRSTSFGLAVDLGAGLRDASTAYTSVDTDDDGAGDTVMTLQAYNMSAVYPTATAVSYDRVDNTWGFRAWLSPDIRVALQDGLEVFIDGTWRGLDMDYRTYYEHILYDSASTDTSLAKSLLDSSLRSGEVMAGVALGSSMESLWKIGVGYRRIDSQFSEDGVDSAGNNVYSSINPNHYPELSLTTTPADDLVSEMVADNDLPPWTDVTNAILLSVGWESKPSVKLRLFASLQAELFNQVQTWYVFNLDTRTVWTETETVNEVSWDVKAVAGLAFELDKGVIFTLDCAGTGMSGDYTGSSETLPYDTEAGTETTNGATDATSSSPLSVEIHAGLCVKY